MRETIVLPLLAIVTCKEMCASSISMRKKGFKDKDIPARKTAPKSTIYRINGVKERGSRLQCTQESPVGAWTGS